MGFTGTEKSLGDFAQQHRDGVFVLRTQQADIGCAASAASSCGFGFGNRDVIADAGVVLRLGVIERFLVRAATV